MDISHDMLGSIKGTELTFENLACVHTVVSLRPFILFIRIKRAKSGGRHRENVTVFDTKYLLIFR